MEIGEYCQIKISDCKEKTLCFILGKRSIESRWAEFEYLVAHKYDIEWKVAVEPNTLKAGADLEQPHPTNVNWQDMPESFTRPEFTGSDRSCGWLYCGPRYGSSFPKPQETPTRELSMNSSFANSAKQYGSRSAKYVYDEMCDGGPIGIFAYLILAVMIGLFCKVISVNVIPYAIVFGDTLPVASGIPIVGWAWDTLTLMYTAMGSFMAWAMLNLGQCLWIMISLDRKVHSKVISEMSAEHKMQGLEGRSNSLDIRNMQRKGIKLPAAILTYSGFIALGCYIAEAIVNFKAYPPVSDFSRFMISIQLGKFEIFNVENIVKLLWGMFSTEIFVVVIIIVWMWTQARKSDATESY